MLQQQPLEEEQNMDHMLKDLLSIKKVMFEVEYKIMEN
jgi:hypothetical protein